MVMTKSIKPESPITSSYRLHQFKLIPHSLIILLIQKSDFSKVVGVLLKSLRNLLTSFDGPYDFKTLGWKYKWIGYVVA